MSNANNHSNDFYQSLFENSLSIMLIINPNDGQIIDANKSAAKFYGYSIGQLKEMFIHQINTLSEDEVKIEMQTAIKENRSFFNFRHKLSSGEIKDVEVYTSPIKIKKNQFLYSVIHDISDQKNNEESLIESEKKFRRLFEDSIDPIAFMENEIFIDCNKAFAKAIGFDSVTDLIGKTPFELSPKNQPDGSDSFKKGKYYVEKALKEGSQRFQWHHKKVNGEDLFVDVSLTRIFEKDKQIFHCIWRDITDLKKSEEKIKELSHMMKLVLNHMPAFLFWKDNNSVYKGCNSNFAKAAGLNVPEEIDGLTDYNLAWASTDAENYIADDREVLKSGVPKLNFIEKQHTAEGKDMWVQTSKIPLKDIRGKIIGVLGAYEDITERKQAETALRQSEEQFRLIFQHSPLGIYIASANGAILGANKALLKMLGSPSIEETKKINTLSFPPLLENGYAKKFDECIKTKSVIFFELPYTSKWNKEIFLSTYLIPLFDENNNVDKVYTIMEDITERKKAEEELEASKKLFEDIANSSSDWIWEFDLNGRYTFISGNVKEMMGYTANEFIGKSAYSFMDPENVEKVKSDLSKIMEAKQPIRDYEIWKTTKDGRKICIMKSGVPIVNENNELIGYRGVEIDITSKKKNAEALRIYTKELEDRNNELKEFVYVASHDLREPLRKVQSFSERLNTKYGNQLDENGNEYIFRMQNAVERMQTLIDDLLAYSRITSKEKQIEMVRLEDVARAVINDLLIPIKEKDATLILGKLPTIKVDRSHMRQLFQNLIGNALKFSKSDIIPEIKIYSEKLSKTENEKFKNFFALIVEDNGIGIDMKYSQKIFGIFERLHGRSDYEGTGIGLSIVKKIVERYKGKVELESELGVGTKLKIYLPLEAKSE